jgi:hypothetical protein
VSSISAPSGFGTFVSRATGLVAVVLASLACIVAAGRLEWIAPALAVFGVVAVITLWRPRYGLYITMILALIFEAQPQEPVMYVGWAIQSNISSWTKLGFINFSTIELLVLMTTVVVLANAIVERRALRYPQVGWPIVAFATLVIASVVWGAAHHGNLTIALWETRSLLLAGLVAFLVPNVMPRRGQAEWLVTLLCIAAVVLSLEIIWRRFVIYDGWEGRQLDLAFAHETPLFFNFVIVFLLARLIWPASARQRWAALIIPLLIYAEMVTERRAGWVSLDVALLMIAILLFKLRPRLFYIGVLPLLVIYAGYLGAFWNASGPIAQPARAVRSINDPNQRDESSNLYRMIETTNVRLNIHANPLTGLGFGKEYVFYYPMQDLSGGWPFFRYMSHNAVLWVWMKMGALGFIAFLSVFGAGIVRGIQLLKAMNRDRAAALMVAFVSLLPMLMVYSYVDLGLTNVRTAVLLGLALGIIGTYRRGAAASQDGSW